MRPRRWLLVLLAVVTVAAVLRALRPPPLLVEVGRVRRAPFEEVVDEDGRTRVRDRYVVSAPLAGRLERITLRAGDTIAAGDLVATIVPSAPPLLDVRTTRELTERVGAAEAGLARTDAELARARAALAQSGVDNERAAALATQGILAPSDLDRTRLALRVAERDAAAAESARHAAEHDLEMARAALASMADDRRDAFSITAPVAGRVFRVLQESAAVVGPGTPLLEIADPADLEVVVDVLTPDAVRIASGAAVRIDRWGGDHPLEGRVRLVEPSGFTKLSALGVEEQRTNVVVDLTSPYDEWRTLGDGFRVDVRVVVFRTDDALVVPASALFRAGGGWAAFVVEDGRCRERAVAATRRGERVALVEGGLVEGDLVVLYPGDAIDEGTRVTPRFAPGPAAAAGS